MGVMLRWLLGVFCTILILAAIGCGGGGNGGGTTTKTSSISVRIAWPASRRSLPSYAQSVSVLVSTAAAPGVGNEVIVNQPATVPQAVDVAIPGSWAAGSYVIDVKAFDGRNGTGQRVASLHSTFTLSGGNPYSVNVSADLKSDIAKIVVSGEPLQVTAGTSIALSATAYNSANMAVMLPANGIVWTLTNGASAGSVTTAGVFTGTSAGSATLQAQEPESGITATTTVVVQPAVVPPNTVTASIAWPAAGRVLPSYAQSVSILVSSAATPGAGNEIIVNQPTTTPGVTALAVPGNWSDGDYTVVAKAFDQRNGLGQRVASLTASFTLSGGKAYTIDISANLQSEVVSLVIPGQPLSLVTGSSLPLAASAYNSASQLLLLPPGWVTWRVVSGAASGSITSAGVLTATTTPGTVTVEAKERDSGVTKTADVTVTQASSGGSTFTGLINWTTNPSTNIPNYADSCLVTVYPQGNPTLAVSKTIARPATLPSQTSTLFSGTYVSGTPYTVDVSASRGGVVVASGTWNFTAGSGPTQADVGVIASQLVAQVRMSNVPTSPMAVGTSIQLSASAVDGTGATKPVPPATFVWTVPSGGTSGTVSNTGLFTATAPGTATVEVYEPNSQKKIQASITVANASGGGIGLSTTAAWARNGRDFGLTGRAAVPFATGMAISWSTSLPPSVNPTSALCIGSNVGYGGASDGSIYAIDLTSGATLWSVSVGGVPWQPAIGSDNTLYYSTQNGNLGAIDLTTRVSRWTVNSGGSAGPITVTDGCVIVCGASAIIAYDAQTGAARWNQPRTGTSVPSSGFGTAYVLAYGIDIASGGSNWLKNYNFGWALMTPYNGLITSFDDRVRLLSTSNGSEQWQFMIPNRPTRACLAGTGSDRVVIGSVGDGLVCIDARTSAVYWRKTVTSSGTNGWFTDVVADSNGNVTAYCVTDATMYRLDGQTGAVLASLPCNAQSGTDTSLSVGPDGTVYAPVNGWSALR